MMDRDRETTGRVTAPTSAARRRREVSDLPPESLARTLGFEGTPRRGTGEALRPAPATSGE